MNRITGYWKDYVQSIPEDLTKETYDILDKLLKNIEEILPEITDLNEKDVFKAQYKETFDKTINKYQLSLHSVDSFDPKIKELQIKINRYFIPQTCFSVKGVFFPPEVMNQITKNLNIFDLCRFEQTHFAAKKTVKEAWIFQAKEIRIWKNLDEKIAYQFFYNLHFFWKKSGLKISYGNKTFKGVFFHLQELKSKEVSPVFSNKRVYAYTKHLKFNVLETVTEPSFKVTHLAIEHKCIKVLKLVQKLVKTFNFVYFYDRICDYNWNNSPLFTAIFFNNLKAVRFFVENEPKLLESCLLIEDALYNSGLILTKHNKTTPLRFACFIGNIEIVKYLLQSGASVDDVPLKEKEKYKDLFHQYILECHLTLSERQKLIIAANNANMTCSYYIEKVVRQNLQM